MFNVYLAQGRDPAERMISAADASEPPDTDRVRGSSIGRVLDQSPKPAPPSSSWRMLGGPCPCR